jgi:hypothetical protein
MRSMNSQPDEGCGPGETELTPTDAEGVFRRISGSNASGRSLSRLEWRLLGLKHATPSMEMPPELLDSMLGGIRRARMQRWFGFGEVALPIRAAAVVLILVAAFTTASIRFSQASPKPLPHGAALASTVHQAPPTTMAPTTTIPPTTTTVAPVVAPTPTTTPPPAPPPPPPAPPSSLETLPVYVAPPSPADQGPMGALRKLRQELAKIFGGKPGQGPGQGDQPHQDGGR